jgi:hypothetical protein
MRGTVASGTLLLIVGVWLLLQTVAGDLPRRLLSLAGVTSSPGRRLDLGDLLPPNPLLSPLKPFTDLLS